MEIRYLSRQATQLDDAIRCLRLPYLYELLVADSDKRIKRKQLGSIAAELLEQMRDEFEIAVYAKFTQLDKLKACSLPSDEDWNREDLETGDNLRKE